MSDDDPFAEPGDGERTVIRPNPGGRRSAATPLAPDPEEAPPRSEGEELARLQPDSPDFVLATTGLNPLHAAASSLFALVSRIRNRAQHPDPEALRRAAVAEIRAFEARALQAGTDPRQVKVARYAIAATLDDVVLNTPWGGQSVWAQQSMVATFHRETVGGDRFYDLLARLEEDPAGNIDLLEFLYVCLSLGFEGRLRVEEGGADRHMAIRARLARLIRGQRGAVESELSPAWAGLDRPYRPRNAWKPVWISAAAVAAALASGFIGLSWALSRETASLTGRLDALDTGLAPSLAGIAPPVIPAPPDDAQLDRVSGFLEEEIAEGLVEVFQDQNTITVRLTGSDMFGSGSADLADRFRTPVARIAAALDETEGPVIVTGHSDNVPIRSTRYPSNLALSLARAQTVRRIIGEMIGEPGRLSAEGRADKDPIASNETPEGRARNRRIEIVLVRTEAER